VKASTKKNTRTGPNPRQSRTLPPFHIVPVLHPDKIEMRILPRSAHLFDPDGFSEIRAMMKNELHLKWRRPTQPKSLSTWTWSAWNDDFAVTFVGRTSHLKDKRSWLCKPFPSSWNLYYNLRWLPDIGLVRLSPQKNDPVLYLTYISRFFELIERIGVHEVPSEIEIACDVPNNLEGRRLAMCARLKRDSSLDLAHFRVGHGNKPFEGPSRNGLAEYSNFRIYPTDDGGRLQLSVYESKYVRPGTDEIRIELRIGPRKLREILKSHTIHRLMESTVYPLPHRSYELKTVSPTLNLLSFIEFFFTDNVIVQDLNNEKLRSKFPLLKCQILSLYSVRGKRFKAISLGLTPSQLESCTSRGQFPTMQVLHPDQFQDQDDNNNNSLIKGSYPLHDPFQNASLPCSHSTFPEITQNQPSPPTANVFSGTYVPENTSSKEIK
jgi:hypothetical protein